MTTSKTKVKDLPASLTDDKKVLSSMKAIQRAGFWAFIIALFAPLILILSLAFGGEPNSSLYVLPIIAIYLGYSGWKMNRLEGGVSITIMLVINMLLSLLMIFGIFPLFLFIMSLIALVKIGAYQKWCKGTKQPAVFHSTNLKKVVCDVHILDPIKGELIEERTIDGTIYNRYVAKDGELYALRRHKEHKTNTVFVDKEVYIATLRDLSLIYGKKYKPLSKRKLEDATLRSLGLK